MRLAFVVAAFLLSGSGLAFAQDAVEESDANAAAPVIVVEDGDEDFGTAGDFTVGFGRPTTFDSLRLDVRESLRPQESFGPANSIGCSPSIPDC